MSRPDWHSHSHVEPVRKSDAPGGPALAEQHIRKMLGATTRDRLAKMTPGASHAGVNVRNVTTVQTNAALPSKATPQTVNADGLPTKPTVPAIMGRKTPVSLSGGSPILAGADRSRTQATAPSSSVDDGFHAMSEIVGGNSPHAVALLESHGVTVGIRAGVMSIQRRYVPTATGLLAQLAGSR